MTLPPALRPAALLFLALGLGPGPHRIAAQEPETASLSLAEAVERALAAHPSIGGARAALAEASAAVGEAGAARLPSLTINASAFQYDDPMLVAPLHGLDLSRVPPFDETLLQGGATLAYTLFDGGARGARIRRARAEAAAADAGLGGAEQALASRVTDAYLRIVLERQVIEAHDRRIGALEAERDRVRRVLEVGRGAEVELLRADAALAEARAARIRREAALDVAERDLSRLTGDAHEAIRGSRLGSLGLADTALASRDALAARAAEASPEVRAARQRLAAADAGLSVARGARWPEFRVLGSFIERGSAAGDREDEWNAGLQVSYPLYSGGAVSRRIERGAAGRTAAEADVRLAELRSAEQVDGALAAARESGARAASLAAAVAGFTEVARVEQLRLDAGAGTQTDYLRAEADLLAARADLAAARHAMVAARVELARATGELTPDWLRRNLEPNP